MESLLLKKQAPNVAETFFRPLVCQEILLPMHGNLVNYSKSRGHWSFLNAPGAPLVFQWKQLHQVILNLTLHIPAPVVDTVGNPLLGQKKRYVRAAKVRVSRLAKQDR